MLTDQNAPVDGPLLNSNDLSSGLGGREFGKVDENLRRGDTDCGVSVEDEQARIGPHLGWLAYWRDH